MSALLREVATRQTPESLVERLRRLPGLGASGIALLRSFPQSDATCVASASPSSARYSFVAAGPFLTFRSFASRCEIRRALPSQPADTCAPRLQFGNPWRVLDGLVARYEMADEWDHPFPLGGCFGYWGYDLKNFVEPKLSRRADNDLGMPDCEVGFHDSLVAFDHCLGKTWIISTGLIADGSRNEDRAKERLDFWGALLAEDPKRPGELPGSRGHLDGPVVSNVTRAQFIECVQRARDYIRAGDIYQVNLSQRLEAACRVSAWDLFQRLGDVSPAPFAAFLDCGEFQIASSSPELFLRMNGRQVQTRPIKGTRPRSADPTRDAQLTYDLQTSPKEIAELVMIVDLLRNDLGKVCEFGSVQAPELVRLERFSQVQHLVATVEGRLLPGVTHCGALASSFPGGSVTGAPKFRAMEIIDELEPVTRGPYTGAIGYLGFNRESQLSIMIRAAICRPRRLYFQVGAGIVADSDPEAEYEETLAKAGGFLAALNLVRPGPKPGRERQAEEGRHKTG